MFLTKKLKGGALYIALIISIVIGIVLGVFILIAHFNQRQVISGLAITQLRMNLRSGLSMAGSESFSEAMNNTWQALPFNGDSLRIKKLQWGSYEVICVESKNNIHYLREAAIYGSALGSDTALLVCDRGRPIGLSGNIRLNGYCYFPKAGFKAAYIEGQSFSGGSDIGRFMKEGPTELPPVKKQLSDRLLKCQQQLDSNTDSLIPALPLQLRMEFSGKTAVWQSPRMELDGIKLTGNIKLVGDEITVGPMAQLEHVFMVAGKVRIRKGFKGVIHVLAKDSIILEDDCSLAYPSSLTLLNRQNDGLLRGIYLGTGCAVNGAVIALNENPSGPIALGRVMIKLNRSCEVYGLVYSADYLHLQGKLFGTALCNALMLITPSAVYENHLLDCELDPVKFGHSLVVPALFTDNASYKPCKWL
jgi:hypothetical protein